MALFNRRSNQQVRLAATDAGQSATEVQPEGALFTTEQFSTLIEVLELDPEATPDDVVAAVTALAEGTVREATEVVDAAGRHPVTIDQRAWTDMKRALQRGLTLDQQEHRLAAEQTVDQAIRLGKASATQREHWISAYVADPETTVHHLNRGKEIPRMEIGYSRDVSFQDEGLGQESPTGWVR